MGKMLMAGVATLAILVGGSSALAKTEAVEITKNGFDDTTVAIVSGDSVTWQNMDTAEHEVVVNGTSCRLSLEPGQSSSCTFSTTGTFTFTDPTTKGNGFAGTLTVGANTRSVSLASTRSVGILGDATTLSGTVSSKQAGENVTIVARANGQPVTSTLVTTTIGGTWSLQVQPQINTTYQAQYEGATSTSVAVSVRPRITLEKVGRARYLAVVVAARSMAGKTVNLTRWTPNAGWVTIGQQPLQSIARTNTTVVTTFSASVNLGTKLRIFMPAAQTAPDYLDGHSNFVVN
jgi:plastocyanin